MRTARERLVIAVASGKGGTGKTSIASCFATVARDRVMVDCDVDAADLHLLSSPERQVETDFVWGKKAMIDSNVCRRCGRCAPAGGSSAAPRSVLSSTRAWNRARPIAASSYPRYGGLPGRWPSGRALSHHL